MGQKLAKIGWELDRADKVMYTLAVSDKTR